jgi:hypothetical protein
MVSKPMEGMSMRTILSVLVTALLVVGCAGATGSPAPAASAPAASTPASVSPPSASASASAETIATPSQSGAFGGVVQFTGDGHATTTTVDGVADGTSVSGTAVTASAEGTHTVKLGCAAQNGDRWALAGKVENTTVHGEPVGAWSAVMVKDGSPQKIAIWLSDDPSSAPDCDAWLAKIDFADIGDENFTPVESGTLVPPPAP